MNPKSHVWIELGAVLATVLAAVFVTGWIHESQARAKAEAIAAQSRTAIDAAQQVIQSKDAEIQARTAAAAAKDTQIDTLIAGLGRKTPAQIVQVVHDQLPPPAPGQSATPAPVVVATASLPAADRAALPNAPQVALVPIAAMSAIAAQQLACQKTANDYGSCQGNLADTQTKFSEAQRQLAARTAESKAWETAAKGGTKFHRFTGIVVKAACAGAGSAVGGFVDKDHTAHGTTVGAAGGVLACSFIK